MGLARAAVLFAMAAAGEPGAEALVAGYRWAFFVGAGTAALGVATALRFVRREREEIWTKGELDAAKDVYTPNYVSHEPAGSEDIRGLEAIK